MEASPKPFRPILQQGQLFWLQDSGIEFADQRGRIPHESDRCCVVVEGTPSLNRADSNTVFVVPTSSRVDIKNAHDVLIPSPPSPKMPVMARVQHAQLILRDDLGSYVQKLPDEITDEILASLALYLNLV